MTDIGTNGSTWWTDTTAEEGWPGLPAAGPVAVVVDPPPPLQPPQPPAPPPPPAPPAQPAPPAPPVTSSAPPIQPQPAPQPAPQPWPVHPPETPPLAERTPPQPPAKRPRTEVEKIDESATATIRGRWGATSQRYRWAMIAVLAVFVLLVGNVIVGRVSNQIGAGVAKPMADLSADFKSALNQQDQPQAVMMNVTSPLAWLPCPLTADAKGMISYDPPGQNDILSAPRAGEVDRQAQKLLVDHKPSELRLTQPDSTHLWVFVNNPTIGTALIDCTNVGTTDTSAPAITPTTAAPR